MISYYSKDTDYLEFFFKRCENYGEFMDNGITVFHDEKNDEIVGYAIDEASKTLISFNDIDIVDKLALLLKVGRVLHEYTQEDMARQLNISLRHYQRLESGQDTTITLLSNIMNILPDIKFASIFEAQNKPLKSA